MTQLGAFDKAELHASGGIDIGASLKTDGQGCSTLRLGRSQTDAGRRLLAARAAIEPRWVNDVARVAQGVVVKVDRHRRLPPVAVKADLAVEGISSTWKRRDTLPGDDPRPIHPDFDKSVLLLGIPYVVDHVVPLLESKRRQLKLGVLPFTSPDREVVPASPKALRDQGTGYVFLLPLSDDQSVVHHREVSGKQDREAVPDVGAEQRIGAGIQFIALGLGAIAAILLDVTFPDRDRDAGLATARVLVGDRDRSGGMTAVAVRSREPEVRNG